MVQRAKKVLRGDENLSRSYIGDHLHATRCEVHGEIHRGASLIELRDGAEVFEVCRMCVETSPDIPVIEVDLVFSVESS